jgi:hypothetical protein
MFPPAAVGCPFFHANDSSSAGGNHHYGTAAPSSSSSSTGFGGVAGGMGRGAGASFSPNFTTPSAAEILFQEEPLFRPPGSTGEAAQWLLAVVCHQCSCRNVCTWLYTVRADMLPRPPAVPNTQPLCSLVPAAVPCIVFLPNRHLHASAGLQANLFHDSAHPPCAICTPATLHSHALCLLPLPLPCVTPGPRHQEEVRPWAMGAGRGVPVFLPLGAVPGAQQMFAGTAFSASVPGTFGTPPDLGQRPASFSERRTPSATSQRGASAAPGAAAAAAGVGGSSWMMGGGGGGGDNPLSGEA